MTVSSQSERLAKAAKQYRKAGEHYREAAVHDAHRRDDKADRQARLGAAHAVKAHQYANQAALAHVTEPAECCA